MFPSVQTLATLTTLILVSGAHHCQPLHQFEHAEQACFTQEQGQREHPILSGPTWAEKYGTQYDQGFSGPLSFSHLPYFRCLENERPNFDLAILGLPFDTAVTYRPGYSCLPSHAIDWQNLYFIFVVQSSFWPFCYPLRESEAARHSGIHAFLGQ
jgi:hypothetical protein